ncbi:methylmalonyl-CoA mutase family protein [Longimicrobium sp.]|uniref:acyl-CoA mutase large subunit family protein n=1 Tax=Longimicrobium sp. TaxID=2029185 RepID=UPI002E3651D6|nr:methylmalonyl-CoA mutase family protein [Longimicrobium sp.]HEX6037315.1 methylmalonyl-CoA mutase family protein [Longimicrobium sp.]
MSVVEHNVPPADLLERIREKEKELESLRAGLAAWEGALERAGQRDVSFTSVSGAEVEPLYTPLDRPAPSAEEAAYYNARVGMPGEFPFTRGPYGTMYRTRLWTMRQFAGFGTAEETNARYHFLLGRGQTGLSVAFDFPTLMGYDSDHPRSLGEVGKCGVAISSLDDMETLFDGIPLDQVSVSMTINGPAIILFCFYMIAAERQGVPFHKLRGTVQNDILKEYQAQHAWVFPPEPALRLIEDMFEWASKNAPKYNPISISGYHIREAGSTAVQELAYTLRNGLEYVRRGVERGLDVDDFAPRLSFFWDVHNDFFEEIAKFRAARRIWARHLRDDFGAKNPESWRLRTHAQTAGVTLTAQQPENNIVRVAYQAMAAVLGGTQSLHTNSMDETLALPTEKAVQIALRTQQVLAYETGVPNTIDPLAGSYYVEALTDRMEAEAEAIFAEIDKLGGVVPGIEVGYFQREIARSAMRQQLEIERGERTIVGVNEFTVEGEELEIPLLKITEEAELRQRERMAAMRQRRDQGKVDAALERLKESARGTENVIPAMLDAVREYATLYEIRAAMEEVFGAYQEPVFF